MDTLEEVIVPFAILSWRTVGTIILIWPVYYVLYLIYNVSPFHPLSKFPGPKIAAASYLYEFWFDMIKGGRYTMKIKEMHEIYGPIVRISPDELHCADPNFIDEIYATGKRKRDRSVHAMRNVPSAQAVSHFGTIDHDLHRKRRGAMSKFFSRSQILRLEPKIHSLAHKLCDKLLEEASSQPIVIADPYSCFATDLAAEYGFGTTFGLMDQGSWRPNFRRAVYSALNMTYIFKFFPFLKITLYAGPWLSKFLPEDMAYLMDIFHITVPGLVEKAKQTKQSGVPDKDSRPNVFAELYNSDLPSEEKSTYRLVGEGTNLLYAGTETASNSLSILTYYILSTPGVLENLTQELRTVTDDPRNLPTWPKLENLPYFSSTIMEGMRLFYGMSVRAPRVATEEDLFYCGKWTPKDGIEEVDVSYVVPRGYPIGMSSAIMHHDENVFPDSHQFKPERWIDENGQRRKDLEKCLLTFSKGSRQCVGINLAYCEVYVCIAAMVLRVFPHMKLYDTTKREVEYSYCMTVAMPASKKGVRVIVS
ncbi:trichodiene oxygenase [Colletotrichum karsti]|uniref:Trichodiene oxygenase n=1 Tax=Colletotrichum karsti TaxID=1095194 RepID=A0A9P6LJK9_9PEZI|nr:trichodiene oxygenase [Colletotrichum karsti]KAF9875010.1 trichodiene oxygenase [Colletotrichum karsti]